MKERVPFLLLALLSVLGILFGAAVLSEVNPPALVAGGLLQLLGAAVIGFGDRFPALAGATPVVVGSVLIIFDPGWRELHAHGALIWMPVATAIVTVNLVRLARRPAQFVVGATGLVGWVVVSTTVQAVAGHSVVTSVLAAAAPILSGACISLFLRLRRAQQDRLREAQRERLRAAEFAAFIERQRLAEELHDTVTHRITLLVMQANVLAATTADRQALAAAESIGATGRTALEELREFLGLLNQPSLDRQHSGTSAEGGSETAQVDAPGPETGRVPGPSELADLITESRGLLPELEYRETGAAHRVPAVVARAVHRIVQEGLTNVHKHAPQAAARVRVDHGSNGVDVAIRNGVSVAGPVAGTGSGSGLAALRRRVLLLGGTFEAVREDAGDFVVTAHIPYVPAPAAIED